MNSDSLYELIYEYTLPQTYPRFNRAKVTLYCAAHYLRVEPRAILDLIAEEKIRIASMETMMLYSSQIENVKSEHAMWAAIERQICFNNMCNQFAELFPFDDRLGSVKSYQSKLVRPSFIPANSSTVGVPVDFRLFQIAQNA